MKVKIVEEVKRSDGLWRFACGDVFYFIRELKLASHIWTQVNNSELLNFCILNYWVELILKTLYGELLNSFHYDHKNSILGDSNRCISLLSHQPSCHHCEKNYFHWNFDQLERLWEFVEVVQPEDMVKAESLLLAPATIINHLQNIFLHSSYLNWNLFKACGDHHFENQFKGRYRWGGG